MKRGRGSLFYKLLLVFVLISILPTILTFSRLLLLNQAMLKAGGVDWALPEKVVRQITVSLTSEAITYVVFTLLISSLVALFVAGELIKPIWQLRQNVEHFRRGEIEQQEEIHTGDEVEELATSFAQMAEELIQLQRGLERQVAERTQQLEQHAHDLERRAVQLTTAADVGRAAASILDLETLAQRVVDLICERFDLYYAGLFLVDVDAGSRYAVLEAGSGEAGRLMKEQGHRLRVGSGSLVGSACARQEARLALDVGGVEPGEEVVRFDNPLLPETRSEMALPLRVGERVLGALDVQSTAAAAFSEEDIIVLQLVADQVAVAVDNARKFSDEAALVEATNPLFRLSRRLTAATTTSEVAQALSESVAETKADRCAVAWFDFAPGGEVATITFLAGWTRRDRSRFALGRPLPISASIFPLPMMMEPLTIEDTRLDPRVPEEARQTLAQIGDLALANIPLRMGDRPLGFVNVGRETAGPWSPADLRLYQTLADQAAVALERARLLEEAQRRASLERTIRDLSDRVTASFDLDTILQTAVEELGAAVGASGGFAELSMVAGGTPAQETPATRQEEGA